MLFYAVVAFKEKEMFDRDNQETLFVLEKTNRVCRLLNIALKAVFGIFLVFWLVAAVMMTRQIMDSGQLSEVGETSLLTVLFFICQGIAIAMMFVILIKIFSDVSKGKSPFEMIQVRRLRLIAGLLLIYGVFDFAISLNTAAAQMSGFDTGYYSSSGNTVVPLNLSPFIAAGVVFAFSFVFKYGVLLQEFSDDTL